MCGNLGDLFLFIIYGISFVVCIVALPIISQLGFKLSELRIKEVEITAIVSVALMLGKGETLVCFILGGNIDPSDSFIPYVIKGLDYVGLGLLIYALIKLIFYFKTQKQNKIETKVNE